MSMYDIITESVKRMSVKRNYFSDKIHRTIKAGLLLLLLHAWSKDDSMQITLQKY